MNRTIIFLSFFFLIACLSAQNSTDTLNQVDANGKKHGYWKKYDDKHLRYEGRFDHGVPSGEFVYYYESGKVKARMKYSENGTISNTTMFFNTGSKMSEGKYINKKREGIWVNYDGYDNKIAEVNYENGEKSGTSTYFYPEGGKLEIINYENGIENGSFAQYFPNQSVKTRGSYKNGEYHGMFAYYYPNNLVYNTGKYVENQREGVWTMYDEKGEVIVKVTYEEGEVVHREVFQEDKDPIKLNMKQSKEEKEKKGTGSTDNGINDPRYDGY